MASTTFLKKVPTKLCLVVWVLFFDSVLGIVTRPTKLDLPGPIQQVSTGGYFTITMSPSHQIEQFGIISQESNGGKEAVTLPMGAKASRVECGGYQCLALADNGLVFAWRRLISGGSQPPTLIIMPNSTEDAIVSLSAGYQFGLLVTESGRVFSFGEGTRGQLGFGPVEEQTDPTLVPGLEHHKIASACAGGHHSLFLTEEGKVLATGANAFGQLGIEGVSGNQYGPKEVAYFTEHPAKSISCGGDHNLALLRSGEVAVWGWGERGQLGYGGTKNLPQPTTLGITGIAQVSAGGYANSLLVDSDGQAFVMGACDNGQCCQEDFNDLLLPRKIRRLSNVTHVSAGGYMHSVFGHQDGSLSVCGDNNYGQLGPLTEDTDDDATTPVSDRTVIEKSSDLGRSLGDGPSAPALVMFQNQRPYQEDVSVYIPDFYDRNGRRMEYLAIFDGHGGQEVSSYLGDNLASVLGDLIQSSGNVTQALEQSFITLDGMIRSQGASFTGSTGLVVLIDCPATTEANATSVKDATTDERDETLHTTDAQCQIHIANIGDSHASLVFQGEKGLEVQRLTFDDRADEPSEQKRITDDGGVVRGGRVAGMLMVSRAFGDFALKQWVIPNPHLCTLQPSLQHKYLLLGSDGLWDNIDDEQILEVVKNADDGPLSMAQRLKALALYPKNNGDNISVLIRPLQ